MKAPAIFVKVAVDIWEMCIQSWIDGTTPWPVDLVETDARWLAAEVEHGRRRRFPGRPALQRRWGWGDKRIRTFLRCNNPTQGPARVQLGSSRGPARVQPGSSPDSVEAEESIEKVHPGSSRGPARVQPGSSRGPQRVGIEKREERREKREEVSSEADAPPVLELVEPVVTPDKPEPQDDWVTLNERYASLPDCKPIRKRAGELGRNLQRLIDYHGLDDAWLMLQWMAYGRGCPKLESLGEGGHRTLKTIGREAHVEQYWTFVSAWRARGSPGLSSGGGVRSSRLLTGTAHLEPRAPRTPRKPNKRPKRLDTQ
jgi:hypothetical protein